MTIPREMKCPECGVAMKEYVLTFRCRNLTCRETIQKRFPPVKKPSDDDTTYIYQVFTDDYDGTIESKSFLNVDDAIEYAKSKMFEPDYEWQWKKGKGIFRRTFMVAGDDHFSGDEPAFAIWVEKSKLN